jgi:hypothetical protein
MLCNNLLTKFQYALWSFTLLNYCNINYTKLNNFGYNMRFVNAWFDPSIIMQKGMKKVRVELLIIEHFPIFFQFPNQMEWFFMHKLEGYKCFWNVRSKGATKKTQEDDEC